MNRRDQRATAGVLLGLTGGLLITLDILETLRTRPQKNPATPARDPRLTRVPRRSELGSATGGGL